MKRYVLAHDLGTSGNKATLFDENGILVASATSGYKTKIFNGNWAEQNPADWWDSVCRSSREVLAGIDASELGVVAFSGQMMACLCIDTEGRPLHDAMIYSDQRSVVQESQIIERIGIERFYRITGHRPSSSYTLEKLMWLRDHYPDVYSSTFKVVQAKDYMNFLLTGEIYTDFNDASGTNAFDLENRCWSEEILEAGNIPLKLFPEAVASTTIIGKVHSGASRQTGIPVGTPVVAGAGDGGCATIGAGSVSEGKAYCYMGSSSWISVTSSLPVFADDLSTFTWAHPIEGLYHPCGTTQTAGTAFNWFTEVMKGDTQYESFLSINNEASLSPPGANGVMFLPYLLGERSPWWNPIAKAEFVGIDVNTSRGDLARAVIEGVGMNLEISRSKIMGDDNSIPVILIGGGAQGSIWRTILADIFQVRIDVPSLLTEATSMGAALIGGIGSGIYNNFDLVEKMNPVIESVEPNLHLADFYSGYRKLFEKTYRCLEPLFAEFKQFHNN